MKQNDVATYFNLFAKNYDTVVLRDRDYVAFEKIPQWVLGSFSPGKKVILDLGCGTGLGAQPFFKRGDEVTGIDISSEMIAVAARYPYARLLCQSLEQPLPFGETTFDGALLIGVMEFIQHPLALFEEIRRVLKPTGFFGVTFPRQLPRDIEEKLEIRTYDAEAIHRVIRESRFHVHQQEDFQGFVSLGETVPYTGYLLS